ncbi:hypothetical protein DIPPA_05856 [Diplonema papillatum]|nr:hypothetical protein DIPPA_05856 [Diplonema papillatum]
MRRRIRTRMTMRTAAQADEAVEEEHCQCSVCDTTRQKGTMMRACAYEWKICAPCFAARKKAKQDEAA